MSSRRRPRKRDLQPQPVTPPRCPYCGQAANLERHPAGPQFKPVWACPRAECDARVGTKDDRRTPLGTLANAALRLARMRAHATFDVLWRGKPKGCRRCGTYPGPRHKPVMKRWEAYCWLAEQMVLAAELCHIGRFDEAQCEVVIELVEHRDTVAKAAACAAKHDGVLELVRVWRFPSCAASDRFLDDCESAGLQAWSMADLGGIRLPTDPAWQA